MNAARGKLIVLEGLDGAGTTTQSERLHTYLSERSIDNHLTREPTEEPIGQLIRGGLRGSLISPTTGGKTTLSEGALCLLFAADRVEHSRVIETLLSNGVQVISDRFIWSSIAYQSLDPAISAERVIDINRGCAVPHLTLFLKVPVDECLSRLQKRNEAHTVYEKKELLENIDRNYAATRPIYEEKFGRVVDIDGTQQPDVVHGAITAIVNEYLSL